MAIQVQLRRGTTAQNNAFTGAVGEVTVDTDKDTAVVHDGATAGGFPLVGEKGTQTITGLKTFSSSVLTTTDINGGTIDGTAIGGASAAAGAFTTLSATGVTTVQAGTVSAPAITTTGDTNTGIFFPAADTIAFAEGGAEAMRISSSANVGIGTSTPTDRLNVGAFSGSNNLTIGSGTTGAGGVYFGDGTGSDRFRGYVAYQHSSDYMEIGTTGTERMRITSAGNVGIGTSTPAEKLHVNSGTGNVPLLLESTDGVVLAQFKDDSSTTFNAVGAQGNALVFYNDTERMRITSDGEVLVGGTTELGSVSGVLSVQRTDNAPSVLLYRNDTSISSGNALGQVGFWGNDTTSNTPTQLAYIQGVASGTHAAGDNPTDIVFGCTNDGSATVDEFARLAQGGASGREFRVTQPTLGNGAASVVFGQAGTAGTLNRLGLVGAYKHSGITNACGYINVTAEDAAENYIWADNSDVLRISTTANHIGTTSGTVVGAQTSDERLKDIAGPVSYGLNEVLSLEPIAFTMKSDPNIAKIGFSAQQVQPIVPEAVYDTKECIDGYTENEETKEQTPNSDRTKLAMEYTQLIPVLVNAVKELSAELDAAKARIATLEGN
jgi:hypothetical protein